MAVLFTKRGKPPVGASTNINIEFTIGGVTYYAEEGMTWAEWCESDYNTGNFSTSGSDYVEQTSTGYYVYDNSGSSLAEKSETIVVGYAYELSW